MTAVDLSGLALGGIAAALDDGAVSFDQAAHQLVLAGYIDAVPAPTRTPLRCSYCDTCGTLWPADGTRCPVCAPGQYDAQLDLTATTCPVCWLPRETCAGHPAPTPIPGDAS